MLEDKYMYLSRGVSTASPHQKPSVQGYMFSVTRVLSSGMGWDKHINPWNKQNASHYNDGNGTK